MGLVVNQDQIPFVKVAGVDMTIVMGFGAFIGSLVVLKSYTAIFITLFQG